MLDDTDSFITPAPETESDTTGDITGDTTRSEGEAPKAPAARKAAKRVPAKKAPAKKATGTSTAAKSTATKKAAAKKTTTKKTAAEPAVASESAAATESASPTTQPVDAPAEQTAAKKTAKRPARKTTKKAATTTSDPGDPVAEQTRVADLTTDSAATAGASPPPATALMFQPPDPSKATPVRRARKTAAAVAASPESEPDTDTRTGTESGAESLEEVEQPEPSRGGRGRSRGTSRSTKKVADTTSVQEPDEETDLDGADDEADDGDESSDEGQTGSSRRRRRRGGRRRRKSGSGEDSAEDGEGLSGDDASVVTSLPEKAGADDRSESRTDEAEAGGESSSSRRRRRRRRPGDDGDGGTDDPENTVTRVRKQRNPEDEITSLHGSTRLEAKKQRRREGREAGRRRAPIVSEAEFLARREAVDRVMVIRQRADLTQIAVIEDKVLVEHYVARESQTSLIGNVYLGRVQNVLPSMEAAFIDIGKGRNAVLYAGEVNWHSLGAGNGPRKIEQVLKSGQPILVQVSKDPIGHKGARLTSQISLPGRFLVYVPDGTTSGISRKLPDIERNRLKTLLKEIVPESAGVIVRTAAEGASEDELTLDVERLTARWEDIAGKVEKGNAPQLLYGEPDLTLKVVRDLFTEDFGKLVVSGDDAWDMVETYVQHVAPDLSERLERYDGGNDVFAAYRIDEQIAKALDRKVWLPSGGSLVIDRTEAMTVVDVNTGKFTGSGGNLEETVTKNNLEAAEEMIRQLRLRDIGGIIVIDFIDMVLESNRDLVLRRMVECLSRDRTRHQVAEVTSLGLVQMTRKRIGTGLLEAFSEDCEHCQGRGLMVHHEPVQTKKQDEEEPRRSRRGRGRGTADDDQGNGNGSGSGSGSGNRSTPTPKDLAAMARPPVEREPMPPEQPADVTAQTAQVERPTTDRTEPRPDGPTEQPATEQPPADERSQETLEPQQTLAPEAPRVVTSSRRRMARRPAGPPTAAASPDGTSADGAAPAAGVDSGPPVAAADRAEPPASDVPPELPGPESLAETAEDASSGSRVAIHVPVKKKGTRKR